MFGRAAHTDTVFMARFRPADANQLATCSYDGSVHIWDMRQHRLLRDLRQARHQPWAPTGWRPAASC